MRSSGEGDGEPIAGEPDLAFAFDKMPIYFGRVAVLEAPELTGQHAVEGVGHHGRDHIEVHLGQDGRGQGVEVEELDRLCDYILYSPATGIVADDPFRRGVRVI